MNNRQVKVLFRFALIIFLQVLLLRLNLHNYVNPYIYPLFLIMLPFETPHWLTVFSGFVLGLTIDMFTNTMGFHACVSLLAGYIRPFILRLQAPAGGYDDEIQPGIRDMGFAWFITHASIIILVHHAALFALEMLGIGNFFYFLGKTLFSSMVSLSLITIYAYFSAARTAGGKYGG